MKIRPAIASDIPALIALNAIAHVPHAKAFPDQLRAHIPPEMIASFFAEKLKSPSSCYLIAEEGEPIGALRSNFLDVAESWQSLAKRVCYIAGIVVVPAFRRRGVASALFEHIEREAIARGATIELDVWDFNDEAKEFFTKLGFKPVSERMYLHPKRPNQALEPTAPSGRGSA
jgi:ribosomal protein S18 acetylase RimI-like enzyme